MREYESAFPYLRDRAIRLLEIGVQNGGSLEIWSRYFPRASVIVGCDIDMDCGRLTFDDPRVRVVIGDVNADATLAAIRRHARKYDVIIDDGSHRSADVVRTFGRLFPSLSDGGIYVVEDMHCSYWRDFEGGLYYPLSAMSFFKRLADTLNHDHWGVTTARADVFRGFSERYGFGIDEASLALIHSVEFVNSMCFVRKGHRSRNDLGRRVIAGTVAPVASAPVETDRRSMRRSDESNNPWTARARPPDEELDQVARTLRERDEQVAQYEWELTRREEEIAGLQRDLAHHEAAAERFTASLAERDAAIDALRGRLSEREQRLSESEQLSEELEAKLKEGARRLEAAVQSLGERDRRMQLAARQIAREQTELRRLYGSAAPSTNVLVRAIATFVVDVRTMALLVRAMGRAATQTGADAARRMFIDYVLLRAYRLVDAEYYRSAYADVAAAGIDPVLHYVAFGAKEGRNPSGYFDTNWYLEQNPDVGQSGMNPLVHYVRYGVHEGRHPNRDAASGNDSRVGPRVPQAEDHGVGAATLGATEYTRLQAGTGVSGRAVTTGRGRSADELDATLARRLANIESYKALIAQYAAARAARKLETSESRVVIYTAVSAGYDSIKLPEHLDPSFEYVLFSDAPAAATGVWQVRPMTYYHQERPRAARFVKTHPHVLFDGYDVAVWIDSNIMITGDIRPFVDEFIASGKAVGAIPHPFRSSIYDEVEACIRQAKGDPEEMRDQVSTYASEGFAHDDLIETGLVMFNLAVSGVREFLDRWWTEIDRHSYRDQLSANYALRQVGLDWHAIAQRPNSVRNLPGLAYFMHDGGVGPAQSIIDALRCPIVDPYEAPPYVDVRDQRITEQQRRRIDIVVCVHNALPDVRECLESVRRTRSGEHQRLIIIDDGSDPPTAEYVASFAQGREWVSVHRNSFALGYTSAANQGLRASTADLVILLNSDTVATDGWADKLADAVFSTAGGGIVGPISNAASHQSIPEQRGTAEQTAVNKLPPGTSPDDMNRLCERWTPSSILPLVPLVHGFCFGVTRAVLDRVGVFDAIHFPRGYGEENDYCFRASAAGFVSVIATHTFVYHAKSRSFKRADRIALMRAGREALRRIHGARRVERAVRSMDTNPLLERMRERARSLETRQLPRDVSPKQVAALVPIRADGHPEATAYIRVIRPLQHSSLASILHLKALPGRLEGIVLGDALLVQRDAIRAPEDADHLVAMCRRRGTKLVYEIDDDLFQLPPSHPATRRFSGPVKQAMSIIATGADTVMVSSEPLKARLAQFNQHVHVLPNALDEALLTPVEAWQPRQERSHVAILYMGTRTHDDDLAILDRPLARLKNEFGDRVAFTCIGGFTASNIHPLITVQPVPHWANVYPEFVKWLLHARRYDIGVAPLLDSVFNRSKSYIKYLDYGICGLAQVLSDVEAYQVAVRPGETGILVANEEDAWFEALAEMVRRPDRSRELGRNAYMDVMANHTLGAQARLRQELWREILSS
ncbi:MAG: glycosyltransferase [Chloroflexota bacterium]|nr:glycosyltransferase [Chloroflexota bacterium]